jgi:hypothetical protein
MALPAALFTGAAPYATWEYWVHLLSAGAVVLAALAAMAWLTRFVATRAAAALLTAARALLALALSTVAVSLWVVGSPPYLRVRAAALSLDVAHGLVQAEGGADPVITAPAWANAVAQGLLAHYGDYVQGRYEPPLPQGYRLSLVAAPPLSELDPILNHGDSAPVPNLAHEVVSTLMASVPVSTIHAVAAAGRAAVGTALGTAVTANRHTPVILIAVLVPTHG